MSRSQRNTIGITVKTPIVILDSDKPPYILTLKKPENINTSSPAITAPSDAYTWSVSADSTASYFEAGTYFVGYSFINSNGETTLSKLKSIVLTAYQSIKISSITLESRIIWFFSTDPESIIFSSMLFSATFLSVRIIISSTI